MLLIAWYFPFLFDVFNIETLDAYNIFMAPYKELHYVASSSFWCNFHGELSGVAPWRLW